MHINYVTLYLIQGKICKLNVQYNCDIAVSGVEHIVLLYFMIINQPFLNYATKYQISL